MTGRLRNTLANICSLSPPTTFSPVLYNLGIFFTVDEDLQIFSSLLPLPSIIYFSPILINIQ